MTDTLTPKQQTDLASYARELRSQALHAEAIVLLSLLLPTPYQWTPFRDFLSSP